MLEAILVLAVEEGEEIPIEPIRLENSSDVWCCTASMSVGDTIGERVCRVGPGSSGPPEAIEEAVMDEMREVRFALLADGVATSSTTRKGVVQ